MKKDLVELVFIVDRSGSMSGIASDMEGAIKSVIDDQKKLEKDVRVSLIQFDNEYEEVFTHRSIADVGKISIHPRNSTALLDAMGKTINSFERNFSGTDEDERPEKVLFVIITDGEENSSYEFSRDKVFGMVETVKRDHGWELIYLGANQDSIAEGNKIGVARHNTLNYMATSRGVSSMSASLRCYTEDYFSGGDAKFDNNDSQD